MRLLALTFLICCQFYSYAQLEYETIEMEAVPLGAVVDMSSDEVDLMANVYFEEAPLPGGERNWKQKIKDEVAEKYPINPQERIQSRMADTPVVFTNFMEENFSYGIPLDSDMAISNDGKIVTVANFHVIVYSEDGELLSKKSLGIFARDLVNLGRKFDPRVEYDAEADRFVIILVSGNSRDQTDALICFSKTNDPAGEWNLYEITGNPRMNNTWADYPMFSISKEEIFLTINSVIEGEPWQTGFSEILVYQMNKNDGYEGKDLRSKIHMGLEIEGRPIRNICPVKSGTGILETGMHFVSNRPWVMNSDSFYLLHIDGTLDDPNMSFTGELLFSDTEYGVSPNVMQASGFLQTNDNRILDAYYLDNEIQFVSNTLDTLTGFSAIYHGFIDDYTTSPVVSGIIHTTGTESYAYPDIAFTGNDPFNGESIVIASYASETKFAGVSAYYVNNSREFSDWVVLKEGEGTIDVLNGAVERWGDYSGLQNQYNNPGVVWGIASYGHSTGSYRAWVSQMAKPGTISNTKEISQDLKIKAFPNPTVDRVYAEIALNSKDKLNVYLTNAIGQKVYTILNGAPQKTGTMYIDFETNDLAAGAYFLIVESEKGKLYNEKIIVK